MIIVIGNGIGTYTTNGRRKITISDYPQKFTIQDISAIYNITQKKLYYVPVEGLSNASASGNDIFIDAGFDDIPSTDEIHIQMHLSGSSLPDEVATSQDVGDTDDTWKDQGEEINCSGYNTICVWVDLTINDSTGNQLQILSKREGGGAEEYKAETSAMYQKTLGDSDISRVYVFDIDNVTPYIQIQTKSTVVGATAGTIDLYVTKGSR